MGEEGVEVAEGVVPVGGVLVDLGAGDEDVESAQAVRGAGDLLQKAHQGGRDVPEGGDLNLHAAGDVLVDDRQESFKAGQSGLLVRDPAADGILLEEAFRVRLLFTVARLEVGQEDDGLVFLVALTEQVVGLTVEVLSRFEEPFELREFLEEFGLLIAFFLREIRGVRLGVGGEAGGEGVEGGGSFGDTLGEDGVQRREDTGLEEIKFGLKQLFLGLSFFGFEIGFGLVELLLGELAVFHAILNVLGVKGALVLAPGVCSKSFLVYACLELLSCGGGFLEIV